MQERLHDAARMLDAFGSVGVATYDVTVTTLLAEKITFRRAMSASVFRRVLPVQLEQAEAKQHNVIVRPHSDAVYLVQCDDISREKILHIRDLCVLVLCTSPNNYQAWFAITPDALNRDTARRLKIGLKVDYVEQAWNFKIALGSISHIESRISKALEEPYHEALSAAKAASIRHVDETGWRQNGVLSWLWSVSTSAVSVFHIHKNRSRNVFVNWMGEENLKHGIWVADRYPVYRVIAPEHLALCHAHIRRDLLRISELPGKAGIQGKRCCEIHKTMFTIIDQYRTERHSFATFRANFRPYFEAFEREVEAGTRCGDKQGSAFFRSLQRSRISLWTFTRVEGVEPTNNAAERSIRKGVIWRRSSLGTQSAVGSQYVERMLTITQTCAKQGRKLLTFLQAALIARLNGAAAPHLVSPVA